MAISDASENRLLRCAIYTRKSVAVGLEKPLNSLETQRGVCRAYIQSQAHRNWVEIPRQYDDGGQQRGEFRGNGRRRRLPRRLGWKRAG